MHKRNGFTIVEILIVIVIIGILAGLVLVGYNGVQDQARITKARNDIKALTKVVDIARSKRLKTMINITGSQATDSACVTLPTGTNLATLPKSHPCWTSYYSAINAIQQAAGVTIANATDPWGRPYLIDENEGENGDCKKDSIALYSQPFTQYAWGGDSRTPDRNVPLSGLSGCAVDPYD